MLRVISHRHTFHRSYDGAPHPGTRGGMHLRASYEDEKSLDRRIRSRCCVLPTRRYSLSLSLVVRHSSWHVFTGRDR